MVEYPDQLAQSLAVLNGMLISEETLETTLRRVAELAQRTVGRCDAVGVALVHDGQASTAVCTSELALQVDKEQYETGEGPCLEAIRRFDTYTIGSLADDHRWPSFRDGALEQGINSVLSIPLTVRGEPLGALNLYSRSTDGFEGCEDVAAMFACQAGVALSNAQVHETSTTLSRQLSEALESRAVIDQAKGILIAREGCTADEAFDVLRRASQRSNQKLREVAQQLVAGSQRQRARGQRPVSR